MKRERGEGVTIRSSLRAFWCQRNGNNWIDWTRNNLHNNEIRPTNLRNLWRPYDPTTRQLCWWPRRPNWPRHNEATFRATFVEKRHTTWMTNFSNDMKCFKAPKRRITKNSFRRGLMLYSCFAPTKLKGQHHDKSTTTTTQTTINTVVYIKTLKH